MRAHIRRRRTFVDINTRHQITRQLHSVRTQTPKRTDGILTFVRASRRNRIVVAFIDVNARAILAWPMAIVAFAMKRANGVHTIGSNRTRIWHGRTFIDIVTIEMIARENETDRTRALECARHVDTDVRTIVRQLTALVDVDACETIFS